MLLVRKALPAALTTPPGPRAEKMRLPTPCSGKGHSIDGNKLKGERSPDYPIVPAVRLPFRDRSAIHEQRVIDHVYR